MIKFFETKTYFRRFRGSPRVMVTTLALVVKGIFWEQIVGFVIQQIKMGDTQVLS